MLNSISRLVETRPEQEWSNGTEFSGYSDFREKRVHSKGAIHLTKISGPISRYFRTTSRGCPQFSKRISRNVLFHLILYWNFRKFWSNRSRPKRIPKFSKTLPGIFTVPFNFGPEISEFSAEWKAPVMLVYSDTHCLQTNLLIFKFCQPQNKRILCFDSQ